MRLSGKLMLLGLVMIAGGLALLVYADPALNAVVIGQSTSTTTSTTTTTATLASGFPGGFSESGFPTSGTSGTGGTGALRSSSSSLSTSSIEENSAGLALALVGLTLVVADTRSRRS